MIISVIIFTIIILIEGVIKRLLAINNEHFIAYSSTLIDSTKNNRNHTIFQDPRILRFLDPLNVILSGYTFQLYAQAMTYTHAHTKQTDAYVVDQTSFVK